MQWVRIHPQVDLLDTPGLMWPKIADAHQAILLAILHIIGDRAYEEYAVALHLLNILRVKRAEELQKRFKNTIQANAAPEELLAGLARTRGLLLPGGHPDRLASWVASLSSPLGDFLYRMIMIAPYENV